MKLRLTVLANPTTVGGTVTGGGTFDSGTSRTVTATANSGYTFINWTNVANALPVSTDASYTFTLNENITLTANFIQNSDLGDVIVEAEPIGGAPATTLPDKGAVRDAVLTQDDIDDINGGDTITIGLEVEAPASAPTDAGIVYGALGSNTLGMFLDISMHKIKSSAPLTAESITTLNEPIKITLEIPANLQKEGRTFSAIAVKGTGVTIHADKDSNPNTLTIETDHFSTYAIVYSGGTTPPRPRPDSDSDSDSGSSGGGGGGGGGYSSTVPVSWWLEPNPAQTLANGAKTSSSDFTRTRSINHQYGVRKAAWQRLKGYKYEHDTVVNNAVQVRLYITAPELIDRDTLVTGWVSSTVVTQRRLLFEKWFANKVRVVHMDNAEPWGQEVQIAARIDLAGWDTKLLYFYSYSVKTNAYTRIPAPRYWIDANGYLHFYTQLAGDIIISEGDLERR